MTLPTPSDNAVTDGKGIVECVAGAMTEAECRWNVTAYSTENSDRFETGKWYGSESLAQAKAEAAIRATLEYLRNAHSPTAWCALMDAIKVEQDFRGVMTVDGSSITPAICAFFDAALSELPSHPHPSPLNPVTEAEEI